MKTHPFNDIPEITWSIDQSRGACIDDHGQCKDYPAWGESEDGRKWIGTATVTHGEWEEIDTDSIELDTE